jgi:hypothetical protein
VRGAEVTEETGWAGIGLAFPNQSLHITASLESSPYAASVSVVSVPIRLTSSPSG